MKTSSSKIVLVTLLAFLFPYHQNLKEASMNLTNSSAKKPIFTNRLINETSPYLLQHSHNPVDWYPWGREALEKARLEDKPILLSIGYSACHWCHVMEQESFENQEIAKIMNANFINIKVDREERPDLDTIYMNYVQMTTGSGGWPMTVFLTPSQIPFYAGTYFPPEDRNGRPGFKRVCLNIAEVYRNKKTEIEVDGPQTIQRLTQMNVLPDSVRKINVESFNQAFNQLFSRFDMTYGGFSGAPKFPSSMNLAFLLRYYLRTGQTKARNFVELSLTKMAAGGMYDQLGGGFHRYSVDERWLVPHFEKMLYDNALLSQLYLEAYQLTQKLIYRRIVEETLDYVAREMLSPQGGFYSTQDADSEGKEGKFFLWKQEQINQILSNQESKVFSLFYDVTSEGNFEGENILNIPKTLSQIATSLSLSEEKLEEILSQSRKQLFQSREERVKPPRDEKIITSWNGLMMVSFVEAAMVLQRPDYLTIAIDNANFMLQHLCEEKIIFRTHKDGNSKLYGYLDDYANFVNGLITLYQATGDRKWLNHAVRYNDEMIQQFWKADQSAFFLTGKKHEKLVTSVRDIYDNATPAGSSVAIFNLLKLAVLTGKSEYRNKAEISLEKMSVPLSQYPSGFGYLLEAADFYLGPIKEIALVGNINQVETQKLLKVIYRSFLPNKVIAILEPDHMQKNQDLPLLKGKKLIKGKPAVYICQDYFCKAPITDPEELAASLEK